jgi:hypothetical protein
MEQEWKNADFLKGPRCRKGTPFDDYSGFLAIGPNGQSGGAGFKAEGYWRKKGGMEIYVSC